MVSSSGLTESTALFLYIAKEIIMANINPVSIYFDSLESAAEWADAHPDVVLTIWGKTQSGNKYRASFILRKKYEEVVSSVEPTVPTV